MRGTLYDLKFSLTETVPRKSLSFTVLLVQCLCCLPFHFYPLTPLFITSTTSVASTASTACLLFGRQLRRFFHRFPSRPYHHQSLFLACDTNTWRRCALCWTTQGNAPSHRMKWFSGMNQSKQWAYPLILLRLFLDLWPKQWCIPQPPKRRFI